MVNTSKLVINLIFLFKNYFWHLCIPL